MCGSWLGIDEVDDELCGLIRFISGLRKLRCETKELKICGPDPRSDKPATRDYYRIGSHKPLQDSPDTFDFGKISLMGMYFRADER